MSSESDETMTLAELDDLERVLSKCRDESIHEGMRDNWRVKLVADVEKRGPALLSLARRALQVESVALLPAKIDHPGLRKIADSAILMLAARGEKAFGATPTTDEGLRMVYDAGREEFLARVARLECELAEARREKRTVHCDHADHCPRCGYQVVELQ